MRVQGIIKNVEVDGYERLLTIEIEGRTVCCNLVQPNEYLEAGQFSTYFQVGARVELVLLLTLVSKSRLTGAANDRGIFQDRPGSPHAIVIGDVVESLAPDVYVISVSPSDKVEVQFETDVEFNIGDVIRVEGELTGENASE